MDDIHKSTSETTAVNGETLEESAIRSYVRHHVLPKYDNFHKEDVVTLFSIHLEIGLINPQRVSEGGGFRYREFMWDLEPHFRRRGSKNSDKNFHKNSTKRRITTLSIGNYRDPFREYRIERVLHLLEQLDGLEHLTLICRYSLALTELVSRFPNLQSLKVTSYFNAIGNRPINIGPLSFVKEMTRASKLEKLVLFGHTLECQDDLGDFLFDLLPVAPNLSTVRLGYNNIQSFQKIARRIRDERKYNNNTNRHHHRQHAVVVSSRLRTLDMGLPLVLNRQKPQPLLHNPLEAEAMETILTKFPELGDIGPIAKHYNAPRVQSMLGINHAGRVLVEHNNTRASDCWKTSGSYNAATTMPLSVWPTVLERAWEKRGSPDGIYYLLQNVQALREAGKREKRTRQHES